MPPVKRSFLIALVVAGVVAGPASAQPTRLLMPGVTYERHVEFTLHGPVVVHVVEAPRPTGLYSLEPVMAKGVVQGREKLTALERKLAPHANVVGVNGDLFAPTGRLQGLFLQGGVLQTQPTGSRSSLGIGASGALSVDRVPFIGDWRGLGPRRGLSALNDQAGPNGTVLFTPDWGRSTPVASDAVEAVLSVFPAAKPNVELTATVTQIVTGGNHPVGPGGAILYARGNAATRLAAEAAVGASLTVRMILPSPFSTAVAGIGGGPLLVKNGKPVFRSNEAFTASWLIPRTARTAVGQRANGSVLLVVVDGGRPGSSVGMTNFELAQKLAGLGAVTGMALDGGASSTLAFDGELLNKPPQGEKPIADALALLYTGVQADPVSPEVFAPGSDGTTLSYQLVRPSTVHARLLGPGSAQVELDGGQRAPGSYRFAWSGAGLPEGRWTWKVSAVDDLGRASDAERPLSLNATLRSVAVSGSRITVELARGATLTIRLERSGTVLRTLLKRQVNAGATSVTWDGRLDGRLRAPKGTYLVRVTATNQVGTAELTATVRRK
jgi:hypothetical protein